MTDNLDDVEYIVIALVDQFVRTAVRFAHDHTESIEALPNIPSQGTWRDIANAIEGLSYGVSAKG